MSASDAAILQVLTERVEKLERALDTFMQQVREHFSGKELHKELYGEPVDHGEEREARRGPGRPPGPRAA